MMNLAAAEDTLYTVWRGADDHGSAGFSSCRGSPTSVIPERYVHIM